MSSSKLLGMGRWIAASMIAASVATFLLLAASSCAQNESLRTNSVRNLENIGRATRKYHDVHEHFPAPFRARDGRPLLSWRVAILPFLDARNLYNEFHLEEPWDSPHNAALLDRMPDVFALPGSSSPNGMTFYRSFSGSGTLFDPANADGTSFSQVTDGYWTLLLVEAREAVPWTRPDSEIPFDARTDKAGTALKKEIGGHFPGGANVLLVDGSVTFLKESIRGPALRALVTRNGNDQFGGEDTSGGIKADTDFEANKSLFAALRTADQFLLYEGLPHQGYERTLLEEERRSKATVTLQGFPFYRNPLEVSTKDQEALTALLGDEGSYRQWPGEKLCDGFHPDYLAEWRVGGLAYQVLICLGCEEIKAFGPGRNVRCDIRRDKVGDLATMLRRYRTNRP